MGLTRIAALAAALVLAVSGCTSMPSSGPVHQVDDVVGPPDEPSAGAYYDPAPPRAGATPDQVIGGFLEAMKAIPVNTKVAQRYLASRARSRWAPEQGVITYETARTSLVRDQVTVAFDGAGRYDSTGSWRGWLSAQERQVTFGLVLEKGEWRIATLPDALMVPSTWFAEQYQRVARYELDPTGTTLVPEPAFVAGGDQLSTHLVRGLLAPVPTELSDVVRTAVPVGTDAGLSVPVTDDGVAQIDLTGSAAPLSPGDRERLAAQFVWTLRQDPRVRSLRITLDGRSLDTSGDLAMNTGAAFDPVGVASDRQLYAVRGNDLVRGSLGDLEPVPDASLPELGMASSIALTPDATRIAVVSSNGESVSVGELTGVTDSLNLRRVAGGDRLREPAWDLQGRLWLVDGDGPARIRVFAANGDVTVVRAPALAGRRIRQLLVSRDGSRVVALVEGSSRDRVLMARVRQDGAGRVNGLVGGRELWFGATPPNRIEAIGWQGPTAVAAVSEPVADITQVQVAGVDGAPVPFSDPVTLRGAPRRLLATPSDSARVQVATTEGVQDSASQSQAGLLGADIRLLGYTG